MTEDLRVGVVGAGIMGADHLSRITHRTNGARVSAIIEPDADRAASVHDRAPQAEIFADIDEAIRADQIDAVLIAVPEQFHEPVLMSALNAKLPILCEKPLTQDSKSSLRVLEAEQNLDKPHIQVGFMRRFDDEYQQLKELITSQDAGQLLMIHAVHRNPSTPQNYTQEMLINGSVVHEFDVIPWLADSRIVNVEVKHPRRNSQAPDHLSEPILVIIELENGVLVDVEMNVSIQFGYQVATEAVFETGVARIGQPNGLQQWSQGYHRTKDHEDYTTRFGRAYDTEVQRWVDAVHSGDLVDGPNAWDGYLVSLCCDAGVAALKQSGAIPINAAQRPTFYS